MAKKDPTPTEWLEAITRGLEYRRRFGLEDYWAELEAMLYHVHQSQGGDSGPNIMISTMDALGSALGVPNPYITVKARRSDSVSRARAVESVDNMLCTEMNLTREVFRMIASAFVWGRGFLKIGYDSEFGWNQDLDLGALEGERLGMSPTQFSPKTLNRIEFNSFQAGMPWAKTVMPHDLVVPWGTFDFDDAPWTAHRIVRHIDDVKADIKYDRAGKVGLEPQMSMKDFVNSYQTVNKTYRLGTTELTTSQESGDVQFVELWEIRDRRTEKIYVVATNHDRYLRNAEDTLQIAGRLPFVGLSFVPRIRNFWTTPDAYYLRYHQAELTDIAIQTAKHRRVSILKMLYAEGAINDDQIDRMLSADVGAAVMVNRGHSLEEAVKPYTPANSNLMLYQDQTVCRENAREMIGFSKNQIGEYEGRGRRTAREVSEVAQASGLRLDRRQMMVRDVYTEAFSIINPIIFQNWKMPRIIEVAGPDGAGRFIPVRGEDLRGDFFYKIGFSVGGNETLQERRQLALTLYSMMRQDPAFDPAKVAQWLSNAFNDPEFTATFAEGVMSNGDQQGGAGAQQVQQGMPMAQGAQMGSPAGPGMGGTQAGPEAA